MFLACLERQPSVARTLANATETVGRIHLAKAISYRMMSERVAQAA
jgi:magnesium chelatase family protein